MTDLHGGLVMEILGGALALMFGYLLWAAHRNPSNNVDLSFLLVDTSLGNVTLAKFGGLLALIVSTWVFVYLPVAGKFDATFAVGYIATWGAVKVASDITSKSKENS
jgi:hypothetical protein